MPLKVEGIEDPAINLVPMIDVIVVLLCYFLVATELVTGESRFEVNLPTVAETQALAGLPDPATVGITADGHLFLDGTAVDLAGLETGLKTMRENYPGQAVLIRGDATTTYQRAIDVLDACRRAGIQSVSMAHRPRE